MKGLKHRMNKDRNNNLRKAQVETDLITRSH